MNYFSEDDPNLNNRIDFQALQNGWASLYLNVSILLEDIEWLNKKGYKVMPLECSAWVDEETTHKRLKEDLDFLNIMEEIRLRFTILSVIWKYYSQEQY